MIFWLSIIIFAVGVVILIANRIGEALSYKYEYSNVSGFILSFGVVISFISAVWFLVAGLILLLTKTNVTATRQANAEKYKALTYKLESEACRDQFVLLNKEIIDEVQR
jgi:Na+-driven multidrug efflux pump